MHSAVKLIIGLLILGAGIYWYMAPVIFGQYGLQNLLQPYLFDGISTAEAFQTVFMGTFGFVLIFLGLIIAWIEYEDLKWEAKEKKVKR